MPAFVGWRAAPLLLTLFGLSLVPALPTPRMVIVEANERRRAATGWVRVIWG